MVIAKSGEQACRGMYSIHVHCICTHSHCNHAVCIACACRYAMLYIGVHLASFPGSPLARNYCITLCECDIIYNI